MSRQPPDDQLRRSSTARHEACSASVVVPYVEYHRQQVLMVQFEGAADQSRRQVCDALTAREPNRGYDYLENRANRRAGGNAHERGALPTGGLSSAAPLRWCSVPADSRANAVLSQETVPTRECTVFYSNQDRYRFTQTGTGTGSTLDRKSVLKKSLKIFVKENDVLQVSRQINGRRI